MFDHLSQNQMLRYRDRRLEGEELLSINRHLVSCEQCRSQYNKLAEADSPAVLQAMLEPNWVSSPSHTLSTSQPRFGKLSLALAIAAIMIVGLAVALFVRSGPTRPGQQLTNGSGGKETQLVANPSPEISPVVEGVTGGSQKQETSQVPPLQKPQELARVVRSEIVTLKGPGSDAAFSLLSPVGTLILNTQPTLSWTPVKDANKYEVSMRPLKGTRSIFTSTTTEPSYTVPAAMLDAYRGQVLQWSVTAQLSNGSEVTAPGNAAPEALFLIADEAKMRKVQAVIQQERNELARAAILANAALLDDAERALDSYLKKNPSDRNAREMLTTVRSWRGKP